MTVRFRYLKRPGRWMDDRALARLVEELTELGRLCLSPLPDYQVFVGTRDALSDKVIATARDSQGILRGFCSAVILPVPAVGNVLHLGLTCVHPELRSRRLTHALVSRLVTRYFVFEHLLRRLWVSNVANVLSSLGSFARHFHDVYPSPFSTSGPPPEALRIAEAFDTRYRHVAYIQKEAVFDPDAFVFRASGRNTAFHKYPGATNTYHRDSAINAFYQRLINFDDGDEMLQVGSVSIVATARYALGKANRNVA